MSIKMMILLLHDFCLNSFVLGNILSYAEEEPWNVQHNVYLLAF